MCLFPFQNTAMRTPNAELVKAAFPNVPYTPTEHPNGTLLDNSKAKRELGFNPQYDWKWKQAADDDGL